jgi:Ser/Thr protein kinase RdoA (MazF antagonist)
MLWETVDPEVALRERFGFGGFSAAAEWVVTVLGTTWGIRAHGCSRIAISDQNAIGWVSSDRGRLILKWSRAGERFARLDASTRLLRDLARQGVPVAAPIATVHRRDRTVLDGPAGELSVAVHPELDGTWLDVSDPEAVHAAGACLARVHGALAHAEGEPPEGLRPRIQRWLDVGDRGFAPEASRRLSELLAATPELDDDVQLVHNDYRAANLLTRGSEIVGVLDFDEVLLDHRVSDLAKAGVYLATRFTDWRPTPSAVRRTLRAGYESVRPLQPVEARWWEVLVLWHGVMAVPGRDDPHGWATGS